MRTEWDGYTRTCQGSWTRDLHVQPYRAGSKISSVRNKCVWKDWPYILNRSTCWSSRSDSVDLPPGTRLQRWRWCGSRWLIACRLHWLKRIRCKRHFVCNYRGSQQCTLTNIQFALDTGNNFQGEFNSNSLSKKAAHSTRGFGIRASYV